MDVQERLKTDLLSDFCPGRGASPTHCNLLHPPLLFATVSVDLNHSGQVNHSNIKISASKI